MASSYIRQTDPYAVPKGLTETRTSGGGTAYSDAEGNEYVRDAGGFRLSGSTAVSSPRRAIEQYNNDLTYLQGEQFPDISKLGSGGTITLPTGTYRKDEKGNFTPVAQESKPESSGKDVYFFSRDPSGNIVYKDSSGTVLPTNPSGGDAYRLNPEQDPNFRKNLFEQPYTEPTTPSATATGKYSQFLDAQIESTKQQSEYLKTQLKANQAALVENINSSFDRQVREMKELNIATEAGLTRAGIRSGRSRYSAEDEIRGLADQHAQGIQRIADLEVKRKTLIDQANQAATDKDVELLFKTTEQIRQLAKDQRTAIKEEYDRTIESEKAMREKAKDKLAAMKITQDMAVQKAQVLAPYIAGFLTGNTDKDAELIRQIAKVQGYEPVYLLGEVQKYQDLQNKKESTSDILNYNLYKQEGGTSGFDEWLTKEANRKAKATGIDKLNELLTPSEASTLGLPYGTTRGEAAGKGITPEKPATEGQKTLALYASRIEQALPTIKNTENDIKNMNIISFETQIKLPAALQSATIQSYMQAARNFINANLRKESGAVISPTEFSDARQQYLPQPGDTDETLRQKEKSRAIVYESFKKGAGSAYEQLGTLLGTNVEYQGKTYSFPSKEKADEFRQKLGI